ncbi:putative metal chaperone YciC [Methanosarcinaceae archaeon Ag5]|uniref:Metal chaperone YciC n=1 Tax=Methanolapillus africanus TaxID=3028297 RepID=A0AAE4SDX4_9EURY|nr:putative metal chaperone YciC [Methanosarcinaceae archaeon Ag5]
MKIIIIGGFLSSGKSTAIQSLGKHFAEAGKTVAVLVNEAGEVDIGGDLFGYDIDTKEVTMACVTCNLKAAITTSVAQLVDKAHPDILFIEPKETVSPLVVREELKLAATKQGGEEYDFAPLITFIDASSFFKNVKEKRKVTFDQIQVSEVVVLNKIDLVDANVVDMIQESVLQINPKAVVLANTNLNETGLNEILKSLG